MDYKKYSDKKNELSSHKIPWRLLSNEEREEIIEDAKKKKEERQRLDNIKKADIIAGKQRTIDNSW